MSIEDVAIALVGVYTSNFFCPITHSIDGSNNGASFPFRRLIIV